MRFIFAMVVVCLTNAVGQQIPTEPIPVCAEELAVYTDSEMKNYIFYLLNLMYPEKLNAKYSREDLYQDLLVEILETPKFELRNQKKLHRNNGDLTQFLRQRVRWLVLKQLRRMKNSLAKEISHEGYEFWIPEYEGAIISGHTDLTPEIIDAGIEPEMWKRTLASTQNAVVSLAEYYGSDETEFWQIYGGEYTAYDMALAVLEESRVWMNEGYGAIDDRSEPRQIAYRAVRGLFRRLVHRKLPSVWRDNLRELLKASDFDQLAVIDMIPADQWEPSLNRCSEKRDWDQTDLNLFRDAFFLRAPTHVLMAKYQIKNGTSLESKKEKTFLRYMRCVALAELPESYVAREFDTTLGIIRGSWQADFDAGYSRLAEYVATNGHARVPSLYEVDGFKLGVWLRGRKAQERTRRLDLEQEYLLNKLGVEWYRNIGSGSFDYERGADI